MNHEFTENEKSQIETLDDMERTLRDALLDIQHAIGIMTRDFTTGTNQSDVDRMVYDKGWAAVSAIRYRFDALDSVAESLNVIKNAAADAEKSFGKIRDQYRQQRIEAGAGDIWAQPAER